MATNSKQSTAEQLNAAQVAISNTLADAEIRKVVAQYGYSAAKLNEGKALYQAAVATVNTHTAVTGTQRAATAQLRAAETDAQDAHQALAQVARAVFANDRARLTALGLTGAMPRATAAFLAAAHGLFDNALNVPEIKTALAAYGYDAAKVQSERAKIAAFDSANQRREAAKGAAQQATHEQDATLKTLTDWVGQYTRIAKVALRDKKQLLEKLGISVRVS